jgi:hypothetical protein
VRLELVWQTTLALPPFFSLLPRKSNQKHFYFFTFYITSIIFYYYPNKKIHYKTKLFHFSIKQL